MNNEKRIAAMVFDFDGTLAELVLDFGVMKDRVADLAGRRLPERPSPNAVPVLEWVDMLAGRIAENNGDKDVFFAEAHDLIIDMEVEAARRGRLFPFARPLLSDLAGRGLRLGVVTRNCRRAVDTVFPDAASYVPVMLSREETDRVKPDPSHLLHALGLLGVAPERALMVGDHPMDIATGRAAGALTAGVASGRVSRDGLAEAGPDHVADNAEALVAALLREGAL